MARKGIKLAGAAGTRLLDAGTHNSLLEAGQFMATVERRRGRYLLSLISEKNF
jgi:dTDP-glucose pyrophosphorylase